MTRLFLEREAKVVIWDINLQQMEETISEFASIGKVVGYKVDVSNVEAIQETAQKVKLDVGFVDVIINNAGIAVGKYFDEHSLADVVKTMETNANAPMLITSAFLGDMLKQSSGHICSITWSG